MLMAGVYTFPTSWGRGRRYSMLTRFTTLQKSTDTENALGIGGPSGRKVHTEIAGFKFGAGT